MTRNRILLLVLVAVLAFLIWWVWPDSGASTKSQPSSTGHGPESAAATTSAEPLRGELANPSLPLAVPGGGASVRTEAGERNLDGRVLVNLGEGLLEVPVTGGTIDAGTNCDQLLTAARERLGALRFLHDSGTCSSFLRLDQGAEGQVPELVLPDRRLCSVRVTDHRQAPIEGATVSSSAGLPIAAGFGQRTDAGGQVTLALFTADEAAIVKVRTEGYLPRALETKLGSSETLVVPLSRILAAGLITDSRCIDLITFLSYPQARELLPDAFPDAVGVNDFMVRGTLDALEQKLGLHAYEKVDWLLLGEGDRWAGAPPCSIALRSSDDRIWGPVSTPLLHLIDPALAPQRPEVADWPRYAAELVLNVQADWPVQDADWPSFLNLMMEKVGEAPRHSWLPNLARRSGPGEYRMLCEIGEFSISGIRDKDMLAKGGGPELVPIPLLRVIPGENAPVVLRIHPNSRLLRCEFRSSEALPLDLHAWLNESTAWPVSPNRRGSSITRWVRRGQTYRLDCAVQGGKGMQAILENLVIPEDAWQSGVWPLNIPERDPISGAALRFR